MLNFNILERLQSVVPVIVDYFLISREFLAGIFQPAMPFLYVVSVIISGVLLWFTIYCISGSQYIKSKVIERYMDMHGIGDVGKYRQLKAWKNVIRRMQTGNPSNWKVAILEADQLMDDILKASGYRGVGVDERFKQAEPNVFSNADALREAHSVRNKIMQDPEYALPKDEALKVLRVFQHAFKDNGLLD